MAISIQTLINTASTNLCILYILVLYISFEQIFNYEILYSNIRIFEYSPSIRLGPSHYTNAHVLSVSYLVANVREANLRTYIIPYTR